MPEQSRKIFMLSRYQNLANKRQIADSLDISLKTVEAHITKVLRILGWDWKIICYHTHNINILKMLLRNRVTAHFPVIYKKVKRARFERNKLLTMNQELLYKYFKGITSVEEERWYSTG